MTWVECYPQCGLFENFQEGLKSLLGKGIKIENKKNKRTYILQPPADHTGYYRYIQDVTYAHMNYPFYITLVKKSQLWQQCLIFGIPVQISEKRATICSLYLPQCTTLGLTIYLRLQNWLIHVCKKFSRNWIPVSGISKTPFCSPFSICFTGSYTNLLLDFSSWNSYTRNERFTFTQGECDFQMDWHSEQLLFEMHTPSVQHFGSIFQRRCTHLTSNFQVS